MTQNAAKKSNDNAPITMDVAGVAGKRLQAIITQIETLLAQRGELNSTIKDIYDEAKATGYEPKVIRQIIRLRAMNDDTRREQEELLDLYRTAIGMVD